MSPRLRRRFLRAGGRRWHLWTGGKGPAVILIHGSPGSSQLVLPIAQRLATYFAVYAFDTPGFGDSEPLPGDPLSVAILADAYAEALDAAGLSRVAVYGTHTGAAIGLEFARRHPARVSGFVLEGVPIFTAEEQAPLLTPEYMPHFDPEVLGGQYSRTWTRFHDQFLWFPWNQRVPAQLLDAPAGSAEEIHLWVEMYYQAMHHYRPAYRAAIAYGEEAIAAASAVRMPGVYLAEHADMLFPHLERLPPLHPGQRIVRFRSWSEAPVQIEAALRSLPPADAGAELPATAAGLEEGFLDLEQGQMFYRAAEVGAGSPLLLLHDAPGAGSALLAIYRALAGKRPVWLPDLPGCGQSDPLPAAVPTLADYAEALATLVRARAGGAVSVYGVGFGAALALELNARHPELVRSLCLTGLLRSDSANRAAWIGRFAPPLSLQPDGSHWYRTWLMLRDSLVHWPWFDRDPVTLRREPAVFDPQQLHAWTRDVMRQWHSYHHLIDAVLAWNPGIALEAARGKLKVGMDPDHALARSDATWVEEERLPSVALDREPHAKAMQLAEWLG